MRSGPKALPRTAHIIEQGIAQRRHPGVKSYAWSTTVITVKYAREDILLPLGMNDSWISTSPERYEAYGGRIWRMVSTEGEARACAVGCCRWRPSTGPVAAVADRCVNWAVYEMLLGYGELGGVAHPFPAGRGGCHRPAPNSRRLRRSRIRSRRDVGVYRNAGREQAQRSKPLMNTAIYQDLEVVSA